MAIDYGQARTGVAVSDPTGSIAGEAWTIVQRDREALVQTIAQAAASRGVEAIVVGLPKNMDGSEGFRARLSAQFADSLRDISGLSVSLWDERLTTVDAHHILNNANRRGKKRKSVIDAVAATLILEGYLGTLGGAPV
ncbi:MAG: Holliday junction resolvase RuvX [Oscillospiraceae bacterium]|jgi:putative Holliday junction resolvase|nr:Holliday junction resolvase RuvX [Oscillospiraceae bacterium]